ncbi:MAG: FIST N-terminal domain-containing protein [Rhizobacter sp.]
MTIEWADAPVASRPVTAAAGQRWFATGRSVDADAHTAGAQAASMALAGRQAALVIVFCPADIDLAAMLEGVRSQTGTAPLIGCTGIAHYTDADAPVELAVVVSVLGGPGFEVCISRADKVSAGQRAAGEKVAEAVESLTREHQMLLLLLDGLAGDQHEVVRGAFSVAGAAIPLAGGCAADNLNYAQTSQFFTDEHGVHVLTDSVVAAAIGSDAPIGVGIAHGWSKFGEPMLVTASEGGKIMTLDDEPALDVFLARVGGTPPPLDDVPKFAKFAMQQPLGMSRRKTEDIRVIHGGNRADGSVTCLADVPAGSLLWTMRSDTASLIASVNDAYEEAVESLGGATPIGLLAFDCGVRFVMLGASGTREEVDLLSRRAGKVPFAGFYTYGEIARSHGARGMHHMTLVMLAFA